MAWETLCGVILLFFTLLGIASFVYFVLFHALAPTGKREYLLLIPSPDSAGKAVCQIYAAQLRAELAGRRHCSGILVVCAGAQQKTAEACACACRACANVSLCTAEELTRLLTIT